MPPWVTPFWDRAADTVFLVVNREKITNSADFLLILGAETEMPERILAQIPLTPLDLTPLGLATPFLFIPALSDDRFAVHLELWSRDGRVDRHTLLFDAGVAPDRLQALPEGEGHGQPLGAGARAIVLNPATLPRFYNPLDDGPLTEVLLPGGLAGAGHGADTRITEARLNGGTVVLSPASGGTVGPCWEHVGSQEPLHAGVATLDLEDRGNPWAGEALQIWVDLGPEEARAVEINRRLVFGFERYADPVDFRARRRSGDKQFGVQPTFVYGEDDGTPFGCTRTLRRLGSSDHGTVRWIAQCDFHGLAHLDRAFVLHAGGARLYLGSSSADIDEAAIHAFAFMGRRALRDKAAGQAVLAAFRRRRPGPDRRTLADGSHVAVAAGRALDMTLPGQGLLAEAAYQIFVNRIAGPDAPPGRVDSYRRCLEALGVDFHHAGSVLANAESVFALLHPQLRLQAQDAADRGAFEAQQEPLTCLDIMGVTLERQVDGGLDWTRSLEGEDRTMGFLAFSAGLTLAPFIRARIPFDPNLTDDQLSDLDTLTALVRLPGLDDAVNRYLADGRGPAREGGAVTRDGLKTITQRCARIEDALNAYRRELVLVVDTLPEGSVLRTEIAERFLHDVQGDNPLQMAGAFVEGVRFAAAWNRRSGGASTLGAFDALLPVDAAALGQIGRAGRWSTLSDTVLMILERIHADWVTRTDDVGSALQVFAHRLAQANGQEPVDGGFEDVLKSSFDLVEQAYRIGAAQPHRETGDTLHSTLDRLSEATRGLPDAFFQSQAGELLAAFVDFVIEHGPDISVGLYSMLRTTAAREEQQATLDAVAALVTPAHAKAASAQVSDPIHQLDTIILGLETAMADTLDEAQTAQEIVAAIRTMPRQDVPKALLDWAADLEATARTALTARDQAGTMVDAMNATRPNDPEAPLDPHEVVPHLDEQIARVLTRSLRDMRTLIARQEAVIDSFADDSPYRDQMQNHFRERRMEDFLGTLRDERYLAQSLAPQIRALGLDSSMIEDLADLMDVFALDNPLFAGRMNMPDLRELRRLITQGHSPTTEEIEAIQSELDRLRALIEAEDPALTPVGFLDRRRKEFRDKLRRVRELVTHYSTNPEQLALAPSVGQVELAREGLKWWRPLYDADRRQIDPVLRQALDAQDLLVPDDDGDDQSVITLR